MHLTHNFFFIQNISNILPSKIIFHTPCIIKYNHLHLFQLMNICIFFNICCFKMSIANTHLITIRCIFHIFVSVSVQPFTKNTHQMYIYVCVFIFMCACIYLYLSVCLSIYLHLSIHIHIYIHTHIHIYIHIRT